MFTRQWKTRLLMLALILTFFAGVVFIVRDSLIAKPPDWPPEIQRKLDFLSGRLKLYDGSGKLIFIYNPEVGYHIKKITITGGVYSVDFSLFD